MSEEELYLKFKRNWFLLLLVLFFSVFYLSYIILETADLGRHIVNGREILAGNYEMLSKNFYSYSQPDFEFPNHHWLFGVVAYLIEQTLGFPGLTLFNFLMYTGAFSLAVFLAKKKSSPKLAVVAGLIAIPYITNRTEVRPESISLFLFSYFVFAADYLNGLIKNAKSLGQIFQKPMVIVAIASVFVSQIIWTNTHLFFIFGPLIFGLYFLENFWAYFIEKKSLRKSLGLSFATKFFLVLALGLFASTVINPHGVSGILSPFHIFDNYAYRVAENQATWFMIKIQNNVAKHLYFIVMAVLGLFTFAPQLLKKKLTLKSLSLALFLLFLIFAVGTQVIVRLGSFFGIVLIPVLAQNFGQIYKAHKKLILKLFNNSLFLMVSSPLVIGVVVFMLYKNLLFPPIANIGLGLAPGSNMSAQFFKQAKLSGPIFNNYDIGGYLIYNLFPDEKVFLDNRPESYSSDFINNEYIAANKNEDDWQRVSEKYQFETIFYYRLDATDWAASFLNRRIQDENWVPVYVDSFVLIFVKNNQENQEIIEKYQLPQEMFVYREL